MYIGKLLNFKFGYDALHLFGTDNMSTADIQAYFDTYDPHFSVEWFNDSTCERVG